MILKSFRDLSCFFFLTITLPLLGQNKIQLKSPDSHIVFSVEVAKKALSYQVIYKGQKLINNSQLDLSFKEKAAFGTNLKMLKPIFKDVDETYQLYVGKTKTVRDQHRQVLIPLVENNGSRRQINLVVRISNEGLAFRYEFPKQKNWDSYILTDENSTFNIAGNPIVSALQWGNYNNTHEGFYQKLPLSEIKADTLLDLPALFEFPQNTYMAITEANLRDYAGMYLTKQNGVLRSRLSPLQGQTEIKVKAVLPHHTPWRVMMISDRVGALIESNILTSLSEPSKIEDPSWLKPGKTSFHWWNGDVTPDTTFSPGINFETNKYYIDFCSRNQIEYHSVIGYGGFAWYKSDAMGYGDVGPDTDVTKLVSGFNMQQVCDYARLKGVGIHVWVHWKAIYPNLEKAFAQFQKWGVKGMMVDFLERDDQEMVNIQEEILKKAAEHQLFIQFHGAYKPTGLHRTYPNEFTREGTLNYENNKWRNEGLSSAHDLDIVFTRLLAGATDYHLGGFRAVPPSEFKTQYTRPLMVGTRCHMLAMYVVLESYLAMVADYPSAYEGQKGFDFLKQVPTVWDETRVLNAEVGKFVTVARRKSDDWYIGSINNATGRTLNIEMDFLSTGNYSAKIYNDGADAEHDPNSVIEKMQIVNKADSITVELKAGGGQVMLLIKQ